MDYGFLSLDFASFRTTGIAIILLLSDSAWSKDAKVFKTL
jgi:hypothetical protein